MIGLVLALQAVVAAAPPASRDVVVVGRRLDNAAARLKACIARGCPPDEEMLAALKLADAQFLAGDYRTARGTVIDSRGRNARFVKEYPVMVAELQRANGKLSSLLGEREDARAAAIGAVTALRTGLPDGDPRVLMTRLELGDAFAKEGWLDAAISNYGDVARAARRAGLQVEEQQALLRTAVLYTAIATGQDRFDGSARRAIAALETGDKPTLAPFRRAASFLRAQLDMRSGKPEAIEAGLRRLEGLQLSEPVLIYTPLIQLGMAGATTPGATAEVGGATPRYDTRGQWIDVSYLIRADGSVGDVQIIRVGGRKDPSWASLVTEAVAHRRYAPVTPPDQLPGILRVERYSLVSDMGAVTGSRLRTGAGAAHLEVVDLTSQARRDAGG